MGQRNQLTSFRNHLESFIFTLGLECWHQLVRGINDHWKNGKLCVIVIFHLLLFRYIVDHPKHCLGWKRAVETNERRKRVFCWISTSTVLAQSKIISRLAAIANSMDFACNIIIFSTSAMFWRTDPNKICSGKHLANINITCFSSEILIQRLVWVLDLYHGSNDKWNWVWEHEYDRRE